ncbi:hypothetical protein [Mucilaginibacter sp. CSA2-8R]|uniref:hypothetical protein n=1 Tax=Mucilaginibacter sp. CSA2-8R TaxID=3141542 RepID=UPI00315DA32F
MKKLALIMVAAFSLSAAQSFAHDHGKGKKKCDGSCCKKEAKVAAAKKSTTTNTKA